MPIWGLCSPDRREQTASGALREFSFDVLDSSSLPERVDESNQWPRTVLVSHNVRGGWQEWNATLWKMNCCLSKQNPTWWESSEVALRCDSALLVTSAERVPLQLILRGAEPGKLIKRRGGGTKTPNSLGRKRREGRAVRPWITGSL